MSTRSHLKTTTALPLDMPGSKCSCKVQDVQRVCTGCYKFFCITCYQEHRRKESQNSGYIINDNDIIVEICRPLQPSNTNGYQFDPLRLRDSIHSARDDLRKREDRVVLSAMKALRNLLDERHDKLMEQMPPITDLESPETAAKYIDTYLKRSKEELRRKNDILEEKGTAKFARVNTKTETLDWNNLIEIVQSPHNDGDARDRRRSKSVIGRPRSLKLEYNNLAEVPLRRIRHGEQPRDSRALVASDHLVMYVANDELIIVEAYADYRVIVPMCTINDSAPDIIDICWSSLSGTFIILTENDVFELSPHLKKLIHLKQIYPANEQIFGGCTCSDRRLLISYYIGDQVDEWEMTGNEKWDKKGEWKLTPQENGGAKCKIRGIRFSRTGATVGCAFLDNAKSDRFEIYDSETMQCKISVVIPAKPCCGFISLIDDQWLVAIQNWHIIYRVSKDGKVVDPVIIAQPGKISIQNITLVDLATVVTRSQRTVAFFDLLAS